MDNFQLFCNQIDNDVQDINFIAQYARTPVAFTIGQKLEKKITIMSDPPINVNTEIWLSKVAKSKYYAMLCDFINFVDIPDELITPDMFSIFTGFPTHNIKQSINHIGRKSPKYIECWYNTFKEQIDSVIEKAKINYILCVDSLKYLQQLFAEEFGKGRLYKYSSNEMEDPDLRNYIYENCFELVDHEKCMKNVISYDMYNLFDFWKDKLVVIPGARDWWTIKNQSVFNDVVYNYPQYHKDVDWHSTLFSLKFDENNIYKMYVTGILETLDWLHLAYLMRKILKESFPYDENSTYNDYYKNLAQIIVSDITTNADRGVHYNILVYIVKNKEYSNRWMFAGNAFIDKVKELMSGC